MVRKSARPLRCLPPMTWARNISRIAALAPSGASTPIRGTTLSVTTWGTPRAGQDRGRPRRGPRRRPPPRPDRASPRPRAAAPARAVRRRCRRRCRRSGARRPAARLRARLAPGRRSRARTPTTLPPLDSATRRPASAVTRASLPTTAIRSPPPALEHASTSAVGRPRVLVDEGGQAGVVPVEDVGVDRRPVRGRGDDPPRGQVDQRGLGERGAEVDADDRPGGVSRGHGRGPPAGRRRSRCRR